MNIKNIIHRSKFYNSGIILKNNESIKKSNNNLKEIKVFFLIWSLVFCQTACKKFVEVEDPYTSTNASIVFNSDNLAIAAVTGIYAQLGISLFDINNTNSIPSLSIFAGLSADELGLYSGVGKTKLGHFHFTNSLSGVNSPDYWTKTYNIIFLANSAIEGLSKSNSLTPAVKQQLLGEAKFMRAFCFFYLVNLYGDVPLITSTNYKVNSNLPRTSKLVVYQQIINDLIEAQVLLNDKYVKSDCVSIYDQGEEEKIRPNKWVATALLARVYLYNKDWKKAENQATALIDNSSLFSLDPLNDVFKKNSSEAIWQLQPVVTGRNTPDGWMFILPPTGPNDGNYPVFISDELLGTFEVNDQRQLNWVKDLSIGGKNYYYPYKYKSATFGAVVTEYEMVFRLGEQYLIRAEARAQVSNLLGALNDLDAIRDRAGLLLVKNTNPNINKEDLLKAILKERQVELFTEWGHRWFDLIRTNNIDPVMTLVSPKKGNNKWWTIQQLYPIPAFELERAPQLTQNPGYN
jgi:hypothetical protein